jgi:hypothetical protein
MKTTFLTTLKNHLKKPHIMPFLAGLMVGVVSILAISAFTNYRFVKIGNAYETSSLKNYQNVYNYNQKQVEKSFNEDSSVLENEKLLATRNQTKWDEAKKTGDYKAIASQISNQGGVTPQKGDCIYNIDPKHNPNIPISRYTVKNTNTDEDAGIFRSNYILSIKSGSSSASTGQDVIGFNLDFLCKKFNPKYSLLDSLGPDRFIKISCDEIMFLSSSFRQKLVFDNCFRMRDNASYWIFRDINGIEYNWNFIGAKEIKDTLQLEIDYK